MSSMSFKNQTGGIMRTSKIWGFIGDNIISLLTIFVGIVVVVLSQLKVIPDSIIPATLLTVLLLLATSELVEERKKLSAIEEKLDNVLEQNLALTEGIKSITFQSRDEAVLYHAKRVREAKVSIDQASIDHKRTRGSSVKEQFDKDRREVVLSGQIKYRYVGILYSKRRLEMGREFVINQKAKNFFAGYFHQPIGEIPLMSFVIVDKKEVITRYPYEFGQDSGYIAIQSPQIAKLFLGYFERLWEHSVKLRDESDYKALLSSVDLNSKE